MEAHHSKRLVSNFLALSIIQGTNFVLPILVMPYVIGRIGADGFGVVSIAQVVMAFFTTISDYGFNLTATRDVSLNRTNTEKISSIVFSVLITRLLICCILFIFLLLFIFAVPGLAQYRVLYILSFTTVIGQSILMNWLFQGIEKMRYITYVSLLARLVFVLLVVLFIRQKQDYVYFIFFTGIGNLLAGLLSIVLAFRMLKLHLRLPSKTDIVAELRNGWHITISNLSVSTYMYVNVLLLRFFTNNTVVGYYSIAEKIISATRQLLSVYFQGIYPQVCQLASKGKESLDKFFRKFYLGFLGLVLLGCLILFAFSSQIASVFIEHNQELPARYLRILSFVPFIICLNIPAYQLLLAFNSKKSLLMVFITGTILNIALNLIIVRHWGAVGTSIVVLITEFFITSGLIFEMKRNKQTSLFNYGIA
jgi:polysaccharide transporter, PST family